MTYRVGFFLEDSLVFTHTEGSMYRAYGANFVTRIVCAYTQVAQGNTGPGSCFTAENETKETEQQQQQNTGAVPAIKDPGHELNPQVVSKTASNVCVLLAIGA